MPLNAAVIDLPCSVAFSDFPVSLATHFAKTDVLSR
jgi:hypothetical protein